jgi:hypothetical protein
LVVYSAFSLVDEGLKITFLIGCSASFLIGCWADGITFLIGCSASFLIGCWATDWLLGWDNVIDTLICLVSGFVYGFY